MTTVTSGQTVNGTVVGSGSSLEVSSGGSVSGNTVVDGGFVTVFDGGLAIGNILDSGGSQVISSGGMASGTILSNTVSIDAVAETVSAGGSSISALVFGLGEEDVSFGGVAFGTVLTGTGANPANEFVLGVASNTAVNSGGGLYINAGGLSIGAVVGSGGSISEQTGFSNQGPAIGSGTILENGAVELVGFNFGTGTAIGTTISSGAEQIVYSRSVASATIVADGGVQIISSGGLASGTSLTGVASASNGTLVETAVEIVSSRGSSISAVVNSGGRLVIEAGGTASGTVISGGSISAIGPGNDAATAVEIVSSGAIATSDHVGSGGAIYVLSGGVTSGAILEGTASQFSFASYETVSSGGTASGTTVGIGGILYVASGGSAVNTILVGGNDPSFANGSSASTVEGGKLDLLSFAYVAGGTVSFDSGTDILTVTEGSVTSSISFSGNYAGTTFHLTQDFGSGTIITQDATVACYARDTRILTMRGEVPVQALQVGDMVATFAGTGAPLKPIRWMGHRRIDLRRHSDPENTHPVRFHAGALGEGFPHRDLVVSPGHRIRIDDVLVTALELVNGASIVQENPDEIEYWHIELDGHDLVLAEGMQAETYQDTGNRSAFENGVVVALNPALDGDIPVPCLPYAGAGSAVRTRLIERAEALGWRRGIDPAPWLEVDGRRIEPDRHGQCCRFTLPQDCQSVRLRSRAGRPWDVNARSGDRRQLGLKLYRLSLEVEGAFQDVDLASPDLRRGFHDIERDPAGRNCRWTIGDTPLTLADLAPGKAVTALEITFDQALPMWNASKLVAPETAECAVSAASRCLAGQEVA